MFQLGLLLYILGSFAPYSLSQSNNTTVDTNFTSINISTTTVDLNFTDNNTTVPSTTVPTTTTTLPTTTTISPSIPGTTIPANTDVSKCPCDLTGNACDVGCCCDPDCSSADVAVFSPCLPYSYTLDDKLCFDQNVFFLENGPTRSGDSGELFCIYYDNNAERNYYTNPSLVTTEADFLKYAAKYRKFSFQPSVATMKLRDFSPYYKSGDPIYIVFQDSAFSYLALPSGFSTSPLCTDSNPAAYLVDKTNVCVRNIPNIAVDCSNNPAFIASTFYEGFRIVKDTFLLQAFNTTSSVQHPILGTVDLSDVTSLYNNSYTIQLMLDPNRPLQCMKNGVTANCSFTIPPTSPIYNNNTCENVLLEVHYKFLTSGTLGIDAAYVSFVFGDVSSTAVEQTFSATFSTVSSSSDPIYRSGNPGYQVGKPIMAGVFNISTDGTTTTERIELIQERNQQLTLVRPSISGDCLEDSAQRREPVLFGQDMRTGCFIQVNSSTVTCQLLQESIIKAIEGYSVPEYDTRLKVYPKTNRYVAIFGNSDIQRTGDWVEILFKNRPTPPETGSPCYLSLGADIQILYANVGSLPNPQAKIIGVAYVYDAPQEVRYKCSGPFCQPGSEMISQKVEISSSVTFIDVSEPPVAVEGVYPTFAARLPYDFFYPFLNTASRSLYYSWYLCLFPVIVFAFCR